MPYSNNSEVLFWGQITSSDLSINIGDTYADSIAYLINLADRAIDDYCDRPHEFFSSGGIEIQNEYYDGVEIGDYGLIVSFGLSVKRRPFLRFKHSPVLSVTKLEKSGSGGSWSELTEGRIADFLVMENGVRFIRSVPSYDYKNVRVTYKTGYVTTPGRISECSARLAAAMVHRIKDSKNRDKATINALSGSTSSEFVGLTKACFTSELKALVRRYRRKVPVKLL